MRNAASTKWCNCKTMCTISPEPGARCVRVWNARRGARVAPRNCTGGDIRRGGGAITVHCRGRGEQNRMVNSPAPFLQTQSRCSPCRPIARTAPARRRRDVPRRGLPTVAPQLEAHNPKEAEPRGSGVTRASKEWLYYSSHLTNNTNTTAIISTNSPANSGDGGDS